MPVRVVQSRRSDLLKLPRHPEGVDFESFQQWALTKHNSGIPIAIDLFSGAGGLSQGIEEAGWAVAVAVDIDDRAIETHRHNFPGLALKVDLSASEARDDFVGLLSSIPIDLVAGGPPCQPFSRAGRSKIRSLVDAGLRDEKDGRRELWQAFLDVALKINPRVVLMENVPDMGLSDDFGIIRRIVDTLEDAEYRTELKLAEAWKFGVPQHRQRLLLLARNDQREFGNLQGSSDRTTVGVSIGDLPPLNGTQGERVLPYLPRDLESPFIKRIRDGADHGVIHDHFTRGVRDDDLEIFKLMDSKTLYSDIPSHLRRYRADSFNDKYNRLGNDDLSRSITAHIAKDGYWYIHPTEHRTLTVREAARIQTFPDRFRFAGSRSDAFKQIGNAVPPLLGATAATALGHNLPVVESLSRWIDIRRSLARWADEQSIQHWFAFPNSAMTPPAALLAALLSNRKLTLDQMHDAIVPFHGLNYFNTPDLEAVLRAIPDRVRVSVETLEPLLWKRRVWEDPDEVESIVSLTPEQRRMFRLLLGEDLMLRTKIAFRVSARVLGTQSDERNVSTEGRVDLARLIGSGQDAPKRMAAVRLIGSELCTPVSPNCAACPLLTVCKSYRPDYQ